ncbi:MAG: hypothetical protein JOZ68_07890 [Acidimicrobiia bacterium]|nr:hypothetical protein [Acidimicrobiia bacterium]MBV8986671.1 hypothetical protein [Acidimicrobiia bacterium]MBV9040911.1 hypothetical protein [Acidimicrobiia bacterium]
MPIIDYVDEKRMLQREPVRLGELWRSQGQEFLDEHAAALQEDVDRLRASYLGDVANASGWSPEVREQLRLRGSKVIDLREPEPVPEGFVCTTDGHSDVMATSRCAHCGATFCSRCVVRLLATQGQPLCKECALVAGGVHHRRPRHVRSGAVKALRPSSR